MADMSNEQAARALDAWMNDRLDRAPGFDSGRGI
jgi:hypothetical protein